MHNPINITARVCICIGTFQFCGLPLIIVEFCGYRNAPPLSINDRVANSDEGIFIFSLVAVTFGQIPCPDWRFVATVFDSSNVVREIFRRTEGLLKKAAFPLLCLDALFCTCFGSEIAANLAARFFAFVSAHFFTCVFFDAADCFHSLA